MTKRDYITPLKIPEGKMGEYQISHIKKAKGEKVFLNNMRNFIFGGQQDSMSGIYDIPTTWHELRYHGGVWMTDFPVEQRQHDELLKPVRHGSVLIGGLGLGYAVACLRDRKKVGPITVVEISPEVNHLVGRYTPGCNVTVRNLHYFLEDYDGPKFTWAFYDIWQLDNESTFFETVCPLLQQSYGIVINRPICWQEGVMRGQLRMGLQTRLLDFVMPENKFPNSPSLDDLCTEKGVIWWDWKVPFWKVFRDRYSKDNDYPRTKKCQALIELYARTYGDPWNTKAWENAINK